MIWETRFVSQVQIMTRRTQKVAFRVPLYLIAIRVKWSKMDVIKMLRVVCRVFVFVLHFRAVPAVRRFVDIGGAAWRRDIIREISRVRRSVVNHMDVRRRGAVAIIQFVVRHRPKRTV